MTTLQDTPSGQRIRIAFVGRRNVGKSALVNAVTGQDVSIVSSRPGTTSDPVRKAMEILPLGPCLLIDTAGLDDTEQKVGSLRVERTLRELRSVDIAVVVTDFTTGIGVYEHQIIDGLRRSGVAFIIAMNKADLPSAIALDVQSVAQSAMARTIATSAITGLGIDKLRQALAETKVEAPDSQRIIGDQLRPGDVVVLVTPIDESAPRGRLILPQQQTLRDVLDAHATAFVTQVPQLAETLSRLTIPPRLVITDSQAFKEVRSIVPQEIPLTSFSILFANYKGDYTILREGVEYLSGLKDGDRVLVCEGCTHHRQCNDIGTNKIPHLVEEWTGKHIEFDFMSGSAWPESVEVLTKYKLIIHCGGCMLSRREMRCRISDAVVAGVPIVNYGILIAKTTIGGIDLPKLDD